MLTNIFLLWVVIVQVSSNPLLQALMQSCPICPNGSKNPLASLAPMLFPQPPQNQPYNQCFPDDRPRCTRTANSCPGYPPCAQNNPCCPCQTPPVCPPNNPNAEIFNKVLSNPALKTILDPGTKFYNQNGVEIPKHPCNNGYPNIVNNYIIIPPEVLIEDVICAPKEEKVLVAEDRKEEKVENKERNVRRRKPKPEGEKHDQRISSVPPERIREQRPPERRRHREKEVGGRNQRPAVPEQRRKNNPRRRNKNKNRDARPNKSSQNSTLDNRHFEALKINTDQKEAGKENENVSTTMEVNVEDVKTTTQPFDHTETTTQTIAFDVDNITETHNRDNNHTKSHEIEQLKLINEELHDEIKFSEQEDKPALIFETNKQQEENKDIETFEKERKYKEIESLLQQEVNALQEVIISDFKKQYPNIPETLIKDLVKHITENIEEKELGIPINNHHDTIIAKNNDQNGKDQENVQEGSTESPKEDEIKQKGNKRRNRQRKLTNQMNFQQPITTKEPVQIITHPPPVSSTTTEKPTTEKSTTTSADTYEKSTKTRPAVVTVTARPLSAISTTSVKDTIETTTNKIETEESIETLGEGLKHSDEDYFIAHDDYYPIFTDKQYFSDEVYSYAPSESIQRQNRESRRYDEDVIKDTTFKPKERKHIFRYPHLRYPPPHRFFRRRRPGIKKTENTITRPKVIELTTENPKEIVTFVPLDAKAETLTKVTKDISINHQSVEQSTEKVNIIQETEEIQFKTPPLLDNIDFETKPINKNFYYHDDDYKISTYSDFKTPQYNINEKVHNTNQKPIDKIETVYARSKVMKYGQPTSDELLARSHLENVNNLFDEHDKTIIVAKSISDDYW